MPNALPFGHSSQCEGIILTAITKVAKFWIATTAWAVVILPGIPPREKGPNGPPNSHGSSRQAKQDKTENGIIFCIGCGTGDNDTRYYYPG